MLNDESPERKKPLEFETATLKSAAWWLFQQSVSSLDEHHRNRCMDLFETIAPLVENCSTIQDFMSRCSLEKGALSSLVLKNLKEKFDKNDLDGTRLLLRTLNSYTWILEKNLMIVEELFEKSGLLEAIFCFLGNIMNEENEMEITMVDESTRETLICKTIVKIVEFLRACLCLDVSQFFQLFDDVRYSLIFVFRSRHFRLSPKRFGRMRCSNSFPTAYFSRRSTSSTRRIWSKRRSSRPL